MTKKKKQETRDLFDVLLTEAPDLQPTIRELEKEFRDLRQAVTIRDRDLAEQRQIVAANDKVQAELRRKAEDCRLEMDRQTQRVRNSEGKHNEEIKALTKKANDYMRCASAMLRLGLVKVYSTRNMEVARRYDRMWEEFKGPFPFVFMGPDRIEAFLDSLPDDMIPPEAVMNMEELSVDRGRWSGYPVEEK